MKRLPVLEEQDTVFRCYFAAKWGRHNEHDGGQEERGLTHIKADVYMTCWGMLGDSDKKGVRK